MEELKSKIKSDKGASGSIETILLIVLAVFAVMAIQRFIMKPLSQSAEGIGSKIEEMNPQTP